MMDELIAPAMEKEQAATGEFLRIILWHFKAIEHNIQWNKNFNGFQGRDKMIFNNAARKIGSAIQDVLNIVPDSDIAWEIRKEIENTPELVEFMALSTELLKVHSEDFPVIVDMINVYLTNKYYPQ